MKGKATVSGGGGGGGGRFADKRAEADVGTNGPTLTMPKSWELSQFVSIELFRRSPRVVGSLEHDLPEVTRAVPEPHKESRHQHPQKSFDLLSEEFTLLRPLLLSDDVDVRRATSCDLVVSDELLVSRHRPRAFRERNVGSTRASTKGTRRMRAFVSRKSPAGCRGGVEFRNHVSQILERSRATRAAPRRAAAAARVVLDHIFLL